MIDCIMWSDLAKAVLFIYSIVLTLWAIDMYTGRKS